MIYGLNFGGPPVPQGIRRLFRARLKLPDMKRGDYAVLQGVAQSERERDEMLAVATNGSRRLHVVRRKTAGADWFGIYVY